MQQNATVACAPPQTPLGELTALPRLSSWLQGGRYAAGKETGKGAKEKGGEGRGEEGKGRRWTGGREDRLTLMCSWNGAAIG